MDDDGNFRSDLSGKIIRYPSIHHILGVRYLLYHYDPLGREGPNFYNHPYNTVVLSRNEHNKIHPEARWLDQLKQIDYPQFIQEVAKIQQKLLAGEKTWITTWDEELTRVAEIKTIALVKNGHPWPEFHRDDFAIPRRIIY